MGTVLAWSIMGLVVGLALAFIVEPPSFPWHGPQWYHHAIYWLVVISFIAVVISGLAFFLQHESRVHTTWVQECINRGGVPVSSYGRADVCAIPTPRVESQP